MRHKEDVLRLAIFACNSWEMALNAGLDVSFGNVWKWKGIQEKATNGKTSVELSTGVALVLLCIDGVIAGRSSRAV
jgi:hypothetical protein